MLVDVFLYAGEAGPDVRLRDPTVAAGGGFPVQFFGLEVWCQGVARSLCLVAEADAPAGMGGVPKVRKGMANLAVYLVETADPNASPVRMQTATGVKAARLKT